MRRPTFKPSLRQMVEQSESAQDYYAAMAGVKREPFHPMKAKQIRRPAGHDGKKLEADVIKDVIGFCVIHPSVGIVERINSGVAIGAEGQYISFHKLYKKGVRKVDLDIQLKSGKRCLIECKREGWTNPTTEREREQAAYLEMMRSFGCIAFFATCTEDVRKYLG